MATVAVLMPIATVAVVVLTVKLLLVVTNSLRKMFLKQRGRGTPSIRGTKPLYKPRRWKVDDEDYHHFSIKHRPSALPQQAFAWEMERDKDENHPDRNIGTEVVPALSGQYTIEITEEVDPQAGHEFSDVNHHSKDEGAFATREIADRESGSFRVDIENLGQPSLRLHELKTIPFSDHNEITEVPTATLGEVAIVSSEDSDDESEDTSYLFFPIYAVKKFFASFFT
ncbi:hypothetical protein R1flu_006876 [Riccia fluitans]|uniref:Uncharacterized protein n=1 Tax=Riccia fluitans TaxID=41844 RepID=A0ABD1Z0B1_9MARC